LRMQYSRTWKYSSFLLAYVSQHIFLFGISLPIYAAVTQEGVPFGLVDVLALGISVGGIAMAASADSTLRTFMIENERRVAKGEKKVGLLDAGLWQYSRHPNYVGEQLMWWGLGLMAYNLGYPEYLLGPLFNSLCLIVATQMVEARMLRSEPRRAEYERYQKTTSAWIPMPKFAIAGEHKD
jgi:steroid 5-alpha reductase family enzyme